MELSRNETTGTFYEQRAATYAAATVAISMERWLKRFEARLPARAAVIDVGCGSGRDLARMRDMGMDPIGIDRSRALAAIAAQHAQVPVLVGDLRFLPFPNGAFVGVWASASLLHLARAEIGPALNEARRVLRVGSVLFVSMKHGFGEARGGDGRCFTYVEPDELGDKLGKARFEIAELSVEPAAPLSATGGHPWISCIAVSR